MVSGAPHQSSGAELHIACSTCVSPGANTAADSSRSVQQQLHAQCPVQCFSIVAYNQRQACKKLGAVRTLNDWSVRAHAILVLAHDELARAQCLCVTLQEVLPAVEVGCAVALPVTVRAQQSTTGIACGAPDGVLHWLLALPAVCCRRGLEPFKRPGEVLTRL